MFDWVNYEAPCPACNQKINEWQTKDHYNTMSYVEPWQVQYFYTSCPNCGAWVTAEVDAEVEHVVKKLDINITAKPKGG